MGAVVQVVNITENFNLVGVDIGGARIHCKGATRDVLEKESHAKKVRDAAKAGKPSDEKEMFTPIRIPGTNQIVLKYDTKIAHQVKIQEEWRIEINPKNPKVWRGELTHISEPDQPRDPKTKELLPRDADSSIVTTEFEFEMTLEKAFKKRKVAEKITTAVDGLTLD